MVRVVVLDIIIGVDSTSCHYFHFDLIKWRGLNVFDGKDFLLADQAQDNQSYYTEFTDATWKTRII